LDAEEFFRAFARRSARVRGYCPHQPHPKQAEFLALDCLEALYGGAAGGGKSDALLMAALQYVDQPGYSAILFRRTYTELSLPDAIMARSHEWLSGTDAHWNGETKAWTFPSGAALAFGYLDSPRDHYRYQGAAFQFIAWDELTQFTEEPYLYLFSRLRRLAGRNVPLRVRAATNPGGIGHEWVGRRFLSEPEDRHFVPALLDDNPSLDKAQYEYALAKLDPITYQQLRHGAWIRDTSGLVYSCFSDANVTAVLPPLPPTESWRYVLGCDFGVTDPTAYVVLAYTPREETVYAVRSAEWTDLAPSETAKIAREWDREYKFEAIVGDIGGLGKGFEAEWRKSFALPMAAAEKSNKLGYIKLLNGEFQGSRVQIVEVGNEKLVKDLRALAWKDEKHAAEHPALDNHLTDALLYGWRRCRHYTVEARSAEPVYNSPEWHQRRVEERMEKKRQRIDREQSDLWWQAELES
jgi:Terminase large subunit, T4likevirus-type, N-terminal